MAGHIRILTYNVQAPFLPSMLPQQDKTLTEEGRLRSVWKAIWQTVTASKVPTFVCLQEVCLPWLSMIEQEMAGMNFHCISSDYSPVTHKQRQPLYTVIFYQPHFFTCAPMAEVLTGISNSDQQVRLALTPHAVAMNGRKCNAIHSGLFTSTGALGGLPAGKQVVVATYHAPCIHQFHESQALHFENALQFLHRQTVPAVLAGDMNTKPTDGAYRLLPGVTDFMSEVLSEHQPTSCSPAMEPACLDYVFGNQFVKPISIRVQAFHRRNALCESQPSDHGLLVASFTIC